VVVGYVEGLTRTRNRVAPMAIPLTLRDFHGVAWASARLINSTISRGHG